ncbi:hypothetical protein TNIN_180741 [Trichonephila inaurata madagascariensis]|uniref:Uncharacterized protein n=1 Tax=Trichonephila inaurata madagascariensis TaxID=2747483 RepID=A0A8X6WTG7_9ARAC|nr:hypothetical protein TNIN_180741 [Trichonephila inaurata madagascariensis]
MVLLGFQPLGITPITHKQSHSLHLLFLIISSNDTAVATTSGAWNYSIENVSHPGLKNQTSEVLTKSQLRSIIREMALGNQEKEDKGKTNDKKPSKNGRKRGGTDLPLASEEISLDTSGDSFATDDT